MPTHFPWPDSKPCRPGSIKGLVPWLIYQTWYNHQYRLYIKKQLQLGTGRDWNRGCRVTIFRSTIWAIQSYNSRNIYWQSNLVKQEMILWPFVWNLKFFTYFAKNIWLKNCHKSIWLTELPSQLKWKELEKCLFLKRDKVFLVTGKKIFKFGMWKLEFYGTNCFFNYRVMLVVEWFIGSFHLYNC